MAQQLKHDRPTLPLPPVLKARFPYSPYPRHLPRLDRPDFQHLRPPRTSCSGSQARCGLSVPCRRDACGRAAALAPVRGTCYSLPSMRMRAAARRPSPMCASRPRPLPRSTRCLQLRSPYPRDRARGLMKMQHRESMADGGESRGGCPTPSSRRRMSTSRSSSGCTATTRSAAPKPINSCSPMGRRGGGRMMS